MNWQKKTSNDSKNNNSSLSGSISRTAGGGLLTALALLFIFLSAISPTANLALMSLASVCIAVAAVRYGIRSAILAVIAASIISSIWPGVIFSLPFAIFFGPWPLLKAVIEKKTCNITANNANKKVETAEIIKARISDLNCIIIKQATASVMIASAILCYFLIFSINPLNILLTEYSVIFPVPIIWVLIIVVAQLAIYLYDWALTLLITLYMRRLHGRI